MCRHEEKSEDEDNSAMTTMWVSSFVDISVVAVVKEEIRESTEPSIDVNLESGQDWQTIWQINLCN